MKEERNMINQEEIMESIDSYLGESEIETLKTITKEKLKTFLKKKVKLNTSYFIKGDQETLKQFKAFYLVLVNKGSNRMKYSYRMLTEYLRTLGEGTVDDIVVDELLFLYSHDNESYRTEASVAWVTSTILNEVANRNRKQLITILLSEKSIPELESSSEFELINFYTDKNEEKRAKALKKSTVNSIQEVNNNDKYTNNKRYNT